MATTLTKLKINDHVWTLLEEPLKKRWGLTYKTQHNIYIHPLHLPAWRARKAPLFLLLNTLIHEYLHARFWHFDDDAVTQIANEAARLIERVLRQRLDSDVIKSLEELLFSTDPS